MAADKQLSWVICFATGAMSNTLATSPDLRPYVADVILGRPLDSQSLPTPTSLPKPEEGLQAMAARLAHFKPALKPPPVFMGVIDDGIAFANARFRLLVGGKHRTRVQDWWMMGTPSNTLNAVDINALFDRYTDGNGVLQRGRWSIAPPGCSTTLYPTTRRWPGASPTARTSWTRPAATIRPTTGSTGRSLACSFRSP